MSLSWQYALQWRSRNDQRMFSLFKVFEKTIQNILGIHQMGIN
ncbi:unnamed protein product [Paramecium sonneborni]|uniref:Uncharacterized protein n=1 Tax=Paramecium sonneborni TaxID=65129 RepID=A0A8S1LID3_9CILI|nr:unnamed protein product [Paramecium sonneborni]